MLINITVIAANNNIQALPEFVHQPRHLFRIDRLAQHRHPRHIRKQHAHLLTALLNRMRFHSIQLLLQRGDHGINRLIRQQAAQTLLGGNCLF